MEAKAKEEAERQRVAEEEERKKRTRKYLQRLRDKVLEEEAALLEGAEGSQIAGSKCKEVAVKMVNSGLHFYFFISLYFIFYFPFLLFFYF